MISEKRPELSKFFTALLHIANYDDMLPDNMESFLKEMTEHHAEIRDILDNKLAVFIELYKPYLDGLSDVECEEVKNSITVEMFTASSTSSNNTVKTAAENYRKNQVKTQLFKLWNEKTNGTKNPRQWSEKFRTPILICVDTKIYEDAKKAFSTLNSSNPGESEIKEALAFLQSADFFDNIADQNFRDKCFRKHIVGDYASLLADIEEVREPLESTGISAYEWNNSPVIRNKISSKASAEYNAGGSDKAVQVIEKMKDDELKKWLTEIVKKDMSLGVKIIVNRED